MTDLKIAFSHLVQEELQKIIDQERYTGWRISSLHPIPSFVVVVSLPGTDFAGELDNPWNGRVHCFRVNVTVQDSLTMMRYPWERAYLGRPHAFLTVYHSTDIELMRADAEFVNVRYPWSDKELAPSLQFGQKMNEVCARIMALIDDPTSQTVLANKLHRAFGIYLLTQKSLPDH